MSSDASERAELLDATMREFRAASGEGVLLAQAIAERLGLTITDLECLGFLEDLGRVPAGRLAEATGLTTGAITGVVDRLERAGYVRRERDPHDRRRVIVERVPERVDRDVGSLYASMATAHLRLFDRYSDDELRLLLDTASRSRAIMHEEVAKLRAAGDEPARETRNLSAPLGAIARGRLQFPRGASRVILGADRSMPDLYRAHFEGPMPTVLVDRGDVRVEYHLALGEWARYALLRGRHAAEVTLNASIPWEIEVDGGLSKVTADLRAVALAGLEVAGGASRVALALGRPLDTAIVRISGGVSELSIRRPGDIPVRLAISGVGSKVRLDKQVLGAAVGDTTLESPGYAAARDRYDIQVRGSASKLSVTGE